MLAVLILKNEHPEYTKQDVLMNTFAVINLTVILHFLLHPEFYQTYLIARVFVVRCKGKGNISTQYDPSVKIAFDD